MVLRVQAFHALASDMGVDLGSGEIRVAEQHLHDSQVSPMIEKVGGKRMAQRVRRKWFVDAGGLRVTFDEVPERLSGHRFASSSRKEMIGSSLPEDLTPSALLETPQPIDRFGTEGYEALAIAFAHHSHDALIEIHLRVTQTHELRDAQSGGIEKLEHRAITKPERIVDTRRTKQRFDISLAQGFR
jgi:hypothetical protein